MAFVAIIPVKPLELGASRLRSVLSDTERARLNWDFLSRTLGVAASCRGHAGTVVVSRDPEALAIACGAGATPLAEEEPGGLNEALEQAARYAAGVGTRRILILPVDLPLVTPEDVAAVAIDADVAIAPDRRGLGTNALCVSPPELLPFRFGRGSFEAHLRSARAVGARPVVVRNPNLAFDIDTTEDYACWRDRADVASNALDRSAR